MRRARRTPAAAERTPLGRQRVKDTCDTRRAHTPLARPPAPREQRGTDGAVAHRADGTPLLELGGSERERARAPAVVRTAHRAQLRRSVPERWVVKDLAGLLFSAFDADVTTREILRFLEVYYACPVRESLVAQRGFLRRVVRRAIRLYRSEHGTPPRLPAGPASFA